MVKLNIVGSGIAGSTMAYLSKEKFQVSVYDRNSYTGGLIHCRISNNGLFHVTGGHVFNTKIERVSKFFWSIFNVDDFNLLIRRADIRSKFFNGDYPIENHLKGLREDFHSKVLTELLLPDTSARTSDFGSYLKEKFGSTLYEIYFKPYNEKIWQTDLRSVSLDWLDGKLPMPSREDILHANIFNSVDSMVHSKFYYPKKGGSQKYIDKLLKGVPVILDNEYTYADAFTNTIHVYTGNVKNISKVFRTVNFPSDLLLQLDKLRSHGTTTVFVKFKEGCNDLDFTWRYFPDIEQKHHRIINTGFFTDENGIRTATLEFTGLVEKEDAYKYCNELNLEFLDYNYAQHTYPIQDESTKETIRKLKNHLKSYNIFLLGRFAEWEYMNMDIVMNSALDIWNELEQNY